MADQKAAKGAGRRAKRERYKSQGRRLKAKVRNVLKRCVPHSHPVTGVEFTAEERLSFAKKFVEGGGKQIPWPQEPEEKKVERINRHNVPANLQGDLRYAEALLKTGKRTWMTPSERQRAAEEAAKKAAQTEARERAMATGKEDQSDD